MIRDLSYFKDKFIAGYEITEDDLQDWLDSFRHVSAAVPLGETTGLEGILENYRLKEVGITPEEIEGLMDMINALLADYIATGTPIAQEQVTGLTEALEDKASVDYVNAYVDGAAVIGPQGEPGGPGEAGVSITEVSVNEDGNLIVLLSDGTNIDAGALPGIDANRFVSLYQGQFTGVQNGANTSFRMRDNYVPGTVKVFRDGARLSGGGGLDYEEMEDARYVQFTVPPTPDELLIFEYIKA